MNASKSEEKSLRATIREMEPKQVLSFPAQKAMYVRTLANDARREIGKRYETGTYWREDGTGEITIKCIE